MVNEQIKVVVTGATGRMGQETVRAIFEAPDLALVGAVDRSRTGESVDEVCGTFGSGLTVSGKLGQLLEEVRADVMVDFTIAGAAPSHALSALQRGVAVVIGTSGLTFEDQTAIRNAAQDYKTPAILVPNFAVGAVLMMKFAEIAAPYMSYCEILEMHHENKLDSPSGTAMHTAEVVASAREAAPSMPDGTVEKAKGARGASVKAVPVHSVRLPGFVASQEVIFGGPGERLSIRHDSIDRKSFMEGVLLAVRQIRNHEGWIVGLDKLMFPHA